MAALSESSQADTRDIHRAVELLRACSRGVVLTGAGISTPSGIPDFRSPGSGLWTRYDPLEVASLSAFRCHPDQFFAWFRPMAQQIAQALPNPAHFALAALEISGYLHTVITQNIDGLHQRAGAKNVLEVHGSLRSLTCTHCFLKYDAQDYLEPYLETGDVPHCSQCHHVLKPDVILFEEQLPSQTWLKAQQACRRSDLVMVAGSSLEVVPVAGLPLEAVNNGAALILINQTPTYLDKRADVILRHNVADVLPRISEALVYGG